MPARQDSAPSIGGIAPIIGGHDFWKNGQSFLQLRNLSKYFKSEYLGII